MLVALARVVLSSGKPKVPFTQKMSLNFVTRKLKTQKLEENNENEETSSAGQATLNEAEVRHYFVVLTFKLTLWDIWF